MAVLVVDGGALSGGRSCGYYARTAVGQFEVDGDETVPFEAVRSQYSYY